jgi:DNA-binding MarR family transcriptional regulator
MAQRSSEQASGLHDHSGYWLDRLRGLVHDSFEALIAEHGVTVAQWSVLITLYRGEASTPAELARFIDVDPGAMTRLLDRLEAKGLLHRVRAVTDRRTVSLELTEKGLALTPRLATLADENDRVFFGTLTEAEQGAFRHYLAKLLTSQGLAPPSSWMVLPSPDAACDPSARRGPASDSI